MQNLIAESGKTILCKKLLILPRAFVIIVGQPYGRVPERPKGADCKSVVFDFSGSNPLSPTTSWQVLVTCHDFYFFNYLKIAAPSYGLPLLHAKTVAALRLLGCKRPCDAFACFGFLRGCACRRKKTNCAQIESGLFECDSHIKTYMSGEFVTYQFHARSIEANCVSANRTPRGWDSLYNLTARQVGILWQHRHWFSLKISGGVALYFPKHQVIVLNLRLLLMARYCFPAARSALFHRFPLQKKENRNSRLCSKPPDNTALRCPSVQK